MVPTHSPSTKAPSTPATEPPASQLSVQVKLVIAGTSSIHSTVTSIGAAANTGIVVSSTVIICVLATATFPQASVTFQVLVMVPPHSLPTKAPSTPATEPPA